MIKRYTTGFCGRQYDAAAYQIMERLTLQYRGRSNDSATDKTIRQLTCSGCRSRSNEEAAAITKPWTTTRYHGRLYNYRSQLQDALNDNTIPRSATRCCGRPYNATAYQIMERLTLQYRDMLYDTAAN